MFSVSGYALSAKRYKRKPGGISAITAFDGK